MKKFKACLFDLDGVIVETDKYHFKAWSSLARELNISFTVNDNERLKGVSRMESLDIVLKLGNLTLDEETKSKLAEKKNELYKSYLSQLSADSILPGVESVLKLLKENDIKVGIGSSSKNANQILKQIGLSDAFDTIVEGSMVENSKPAPDIFLLGAKNLNVKPENCLVIEDAAAGVESAKRANMKCVGVGNYKDLSDANLVIENLENVSLADLRSLFLKK